MKRAILPALVAVCCADIARAQLGPCDEIGVYADSGGNNCRITQAPFLVPYTVYVVHQAPNGATGSAWKVNDATGLPRCGTSTPYTATGDPYTGVSLEYPTCLSGRIVVYELCYLGSMDTTPCLKLDVVAHPDIGGFSPQFTDCFGRPRPMDGWAGYINPGECECVHGDCIIPTEQQTWGRIKALYR